MRVAGALFLIAASLLLASCGGEGGAAGSAPAETGEATKTQVDEGAAQAPKFEEGHVLIETKGDPASVLVEIAEEPEQHAYGLMFRKSLPPDRGMIFEFPTDQSSGFWMKNTLIPLSIAYYDANGKILKIMDMEPCEADPCPSYDPGSAYRGALEVNQGAFARWGVEVGDTVVLHRF